eukprot:CAMPEP_0194032112 /NCGR_PEP_ID=MMETSP0009_2-20130614/5123_1 /TAXON_ID=210454 /ORGANISM="Grammatophora oceanica, Strain CCMP 410" /LENGTH=337 /DNA_ID=CAMNT_0038672453 /DNA_START=40 /DNA_END=1053 /DNA_ORIENTATION=-
MAPRTEDGMDAMNSPGRRGIAFIDTKHSLSLESIHLKEIDLRKTFDSISSKGNDLLSLLSSSSASSSQSCALVEACYGSLSSEGRVLSEEASLLLQSVDNQDEKEDDTNMRVRASLAQLRFDRYIATVVDAMKHPAKDKLGVGLESLAASATNSDDSAVKVSSWRAPSLAFDVAIAPPIETMVGPSSHPLNVRVKAMVEVLANDAVASSSDQRRVPYNTCQIAVEPSSCHGRLEFVGVSGLSGDALLRVKVSPTGSDSQEQKVWGRDSEVEKIHVKEARVVQVNARQPRSKCAVNLYTSYTYGKPDADLILRFPTFATRSDEVPPQVHIELVVVGST